MKTFYLRILAADKCLYEGDCAGLKFQMSDGYMGLLAGHADMMCALVPGVMKIAVPEGDGSQESRTAAVSEGLLIFEDNKATVLCETAEFAEDIDILKAERDAESARERLKTEHERAALLIAEADLRRAISRIRANKVK